MSIAKIQTGDKVKVIAGNYKGVLGVVTRVIHKKTAKGVILSTRATVNSIPKIVKFKKVYNSQTQGNQGMRLDTDRTLNISNLSLVTEDNQISKVRIELRDGKRVRVYKKNGLLVTKASTSELAEPVKIAAVTSMEEELSKLQIQEEITETKVKKPRAKKVVTDIETVETKTPEAKTDGDVELEQPKPKKTRVKAKTEDTQES